MSSETQFRIRNDDTDLLTELEDELRRLQLKHNVGNLVSGDIDDREEYNVNGTVKAKQEHSVNMFLLQLETMVRDTSSMKKSIRAVLSNEEVPMGHDLNTPIRKARRIMEIYRAIAQSNPLKDTILLDKRDKILLQRLGTESIKTSVKRLFSDIEEVEDELRPYLKWHTIQKTERIVRLLSSEKELISKISDINISAMAFDDFETRILQFCQNLMDIERMQKISTRSIPTTPTEDVTTMSSNATTVTVDKTEYDALLAASHNSRNGGRNRAASPYQPRVEFQGRSQQSSYSRTDRSRSRDRGRYRPSDRESSRDRVYQQGLTPYSYRNTRGRSQERRRDFSNDRRSR